MFSVVKITQIHHYQQCRTYISRTRTVKLYFWSLTGLKFPVSTVHVCFFVKGFFFRSSGKKVNFHSHITLEYPSSVNLLLVSFITTLTHSKIESLTINISLFNPSPLLPGFHPGCLQTKRNPMSRAFLCCTSTAPYPCLTLCCLPL